MENKYIYEPAEDSDLLLKNVLNYLEKHYKLNSSIKKSNSFNSNHNLDINILEVGVGSGYIIYNLCKFPHFNYFGVDINKFALQETENKFRDCNKKIKLWNCDLFPDDEKDIELNKKFDIILFNPPYLPDEEEKKNLDSLKKIVESKINKNNNFNDNTTSNDSIKNSDNNNNKVYNNNYNYNKDFTNEFNNESKNKTIVNEQKDELMKKALYGGKSGVEVTIEFFKEVNYYLKDNGVIFILVSTLSDYNYLLYFLKILDYKFEITDKKNFFFEKLLCLKVIKTDFLKEVSQIKNLDYLSKGKHSIVLKGVFKNKEVVIKRGKEEYINKEIFFLKKLQNYSFVPELYFHGKNFVVIEFIKGRLIEEFLSKASKEEIIETINKILKITFELDKIKINKFEFVNPKKHIFIGEDIGKDKVDKNKIIVKLIDFERSIFSENPKNTRQFLQYLKNLKIKEILKNKELIIDEESIIKLGKNLSKKLRLIKFEEILK